MQLLKVGKSNVVTEFQPLEFIGLNKLANTFVRLVSNLNANESCKFENCVFEALEDIIDFISSEKTP